MRCFAGAVQRGPARYALGLAALLALTLAPLWTAGRLALALALSAGTSASLIVAASTTTVAIATASIGLDLGAVLNPALPWLVLA